MNEKSVFGDDKICDYCAEIIGDEEECQNRKVKKNENAVQEKRTGRTCCLPFRLFERRIPEGDSRLLKPTGN
jgi:hypothetical protein